MYQSWRGVVWRVALVSIAVSAIGLGGTSTSANAPQPPDEPWIVTEVIDGDTLEVARDATIVTVRLIGINTPESGECWSDEATDALTDLVGTGPCG